MGQFPVFSKAPQPMAHLPTFVAGEGDGGVGRDFQHAGEAAHIEPSHATTVPGLPHAVLQTVCRRFGDRLPGDGRSQVLMVGSLELGESGDGERL